MTTVIQDTDIFVNIFRRREVAEFTNELTKDSVNISYIENEESTSVNTLNIFDKSLNLSENTSFINTSTGTFQTIAFYLTTKNALFTSIYATSDGIYQDQNSLPLFRFHLIDPYHLTRVDFQDWSYIDSDLTIDASNSLIDIQILDQNFQPIQLTEQWIDWNKGIIYLNLYNHLDKSTQVCTLYYIQYTVQTNTSNITYIDLLDSHPYYGDQDSQYESARRLATYHRTDLPLVGNYYEFSTMQFYSIKILAIPLQIQSIDLQPNTAPWFLNCSKGGFFRAGLKYEGIVYDLQYIGSQSATILTNNLIYTPFPLMFYQETWANGRINIEINDINNKAIAAFTNSSTIEGTIATNGSIYQKWNTATLTGIQSIDTFNGIIQLAGIVLFDTDQVYVDYAIGLDSEYFIQDIEDGIVAIENFNPFMIPELKEQMAVIAVEPTLYDNYQIPIFFIINKYGQIIRSSWAKFDNTTQRVSTLVSLPSHTRDKSLYYSSIPSNITNAVCYIDEFTVEGVNSYSFKHLVLGEVTFNPVGSPETIKYKDVRVRGGGIPSIQHDNLLLKNQEISNYTDIGFWDGTPYPGNGTFLVEIPADLLENFGGNFSHEALKEIISNHIAVGIYPIIRTYWADINITVVNPSLSQIDLQWETYNNIIEVRYNVYLADKNNGPWTKFNISELTSKSYSFTNLFANTLYYIKIEPAYLNENNEWIAMRNSTEKIIEVKTLK